MGKTDYQKAQSADRKGLPVRDWHPGRVTNKYRDNYDATFRGKKKNIRADKKEVDK